MYILKANKVITCHKYQLLIFCPFTFTIFANDQYAKKFISVHLKEILLGLSDDEPFLCGITAFGRDYSIINQISGSILATWMTHFFF